MTSRDFCYWLQGYFEVAEHGRTTTGGSCAAVTLTNDQVQVVRQHLAMVFKHEIDPSMGDASHQAALNLLHNTKPEPPEGVKYRC